MGTSTSTTAPKFLLAGATAAPEERTLARDEAGSVRAGPGRRGVAIAVLEGEVWVTVEGDPEDHIVAAGQRFAPDRAGRVAFLALRPSRIRIERVVRERRPSRRAA